MRNLGTVRHRRTQMSAALRACKTLVQKRDKYGVAAAPLLVYGGRRQNAEFRNDAAVPYTAARSETPLSGRVRRSYRSAIYAALLPRPLWFMAGAANVAMRIQPDCGRRAFPALGSDIWHSAGSAPNPPLSRRSGEHIAGANNLRKPKPGARYPETQKITMRGEGQSREHSKRRWLWAR